MVLKLEIKKTLTARSDRVKCVDFHPSEPWLLVSLYNGQVHIWNYETQTLVKTFEASSLPARTGKFIARKNWFIVGTDDFYLRIFNYNTHEKVHAFEAHVDYIRSIACHPSQPYILSCADDSLIKLWDWEKGWKNIMVFEGHTHYIMSVVFNPKDSNTFATASLDKTIKVWNIGSSTPNYTLEGHEKGVNWVDYYHGGEKPYLVSGADDKLVKIWDYQNKTCVQTLEGHSQNVCFTCFHPDLPIIISGSEDGTVKLWHANTYRLENSLNYGFDRVWCIACRKGNNAVALGYDEGTVVLRLGKEEPSISMDQTGKLIWARHNEIQTAHVQSQDLVGLSDGDRVTLITKDLGNCEVFPQSLKHSPNGRFAVVCGDGEYIIYTALSWRNKSFGNGLEFVWQKDSNEYAVRESTQKITTFKNFKERHVIKPPFTCDGLDGGELLALKGQNFLCFYDWNTGYLVRRIDVNAKNVYWSDNSDLVCICTEETFYILKYNKEEVENALADESRANKEAGVESGFDVKLEISDNVKSGCWIGDCFIYVTATNRLNYLIGSQVNTISHFDTSKYLLGYMPKESKVLVADKDFNVFAYNLSLQVLEYQTAVMRKDFQTCQRVLPSLSNEQRNKAARFLEQIENGALREMAMEVTTDIEHRFDLALQLRKIEIAYEIAQKLDQEMKWKQVGDFALQEWRLEMGLECLKKAKDFDSLLMLYHATGQCKEVLQLAKDSEAAGKTNLTFLCYFLSNQPEQCLELLIRTGRLQEAALFARTYIPSHCPRVVQLWKDELSAKQTEKKWAEALSDPCEYENLFPDFKYALLAEMGMSSAGAGGKQSVSLPEWKRRIESDPVQMAKSRFPNEQELPSVTELMQQAIAIKQQQQQQKVSVTPTATEAVSPLQKKEQLISPPVTEKPEEKKPPAPTAAAKPPSTTSSPMKSPLNNPANAIPYTLPPKHQHHSNPATSKSNSRLTAEGLTEEFDGISDNMSLMSMEVNTTGTGSNKGESEQVEDLVSEISYASTDNLQQQQHGGSNRHPLASVNVAAPPKVTPAVDDLDDLLVDTTASTNNFSQLSPNDQQKIVHSTGDDELDEILNM